MTPEEREALRQEQRDALWKWRWLGWRRSTPAFKLFMALAAAAVVLRVVMYLLP